MIVYLLAGKTTIADLKLVSPLGDFVISRTWVCLALGAFGVLGIVYGLLERALRKNLIKHLGNRFRKQEQVIDPNRSSSGLTEEGETGRRDKW